jgi:serine/threonine protein kinase
MKFAYTTGSRPLDGYTIKRGIGVGGFGDVYFATTDAGKEVALKRVQRNLDIEIRGVSQCLNLKHPNLVALYDIKYDDEGQAWVVMEYVAGDSLKDVIDRNPNGLPRDEIQTWFRGLASGVAYLHEHGIVHRDLKPGNLFIDDATVKVGDYGLSKFISCSRRSGQTESVGTFHYMAPEIGRGSYGREIDIYALGIVLHEMLTGRVPFDGESSQEIIMKHLTADPDLSGLPQPFRAVIAKALMKDPEQRFHEVSEMLAALGWDDPARVVVDSPASSSPVVAPPAVASVAQSPPDRRAEVLEINEHNADSKPQVIYIGEETPVGSEGIKFGHVREQPPIIGGVASHRRAARAGASANAPRPGVGAVVGARPVGVASAAAQATDMTVEPGAREPIAAALGGAFRQVTGWWNTSSLGAPLKVLLVLAAGVALLFNATWLVPVAMGAGILYVVYYGIWATVQAWHHSDLQESSTLESTAAGALPGNAFRRRKWQDAARDMLRRRSPGEKIAELTGSLLMAALATCILTVVMMIIGAGAQPLGSSIDNVALFAWFASTATLGAWTVLIAGKAIENKSGDAVRRRFAMLIVGLALGAISFALASTLMIRMHDAMDFPSVTGATHSSSLYDGQQMPLLPVYLAYFGGIFLVLRWWKQVDPLRVTRLSIWATGVCVLWGAVLEMFWHFPQPWGLMLVATISLAAQLSAPWLTNAQRSEMRRAARLPLTRS